ncbi:MAG TPA: BTAD domain-containing putative transcriptional regulator [Gemmatimonadaceae bacterium]|nr:BTAD domain-containing putative transcriptional regulator [Gemmatimonadaceae bacterium]
MIELRMLGEIRLRTDEGEELHALLRQPKRLALLTYLAAPTPGTWHRRDMLLAIFWPDLDTAHARTSLRNGVYVLRQALGDGAVRSRGDEELSIDPDLVRTDVAGVWSALKSSRPEEALERYGGELLPGLFPSGGDGFQRWLDTERLRLKASVSTAALARVSALEKDGKIEQALAMARRVSEIQPDDETLVRRVMSLHETMGDRAGALAVFEAYRSRLASDFDAQPAPETLALANRLRAAAPSLTPAPPASKRINRYVAAVPRSTADVPRAAVEPDTAQLVTGELSAEQLYPDQHIDQPGRHVRGNRRNRQVVRFVGAAAVGAAIIAALAWRSSRTPGPLAIGTSTPLTADEGLQIEAAISPNGRLVAYAKGNAKRLRIFIQKINGGAPWALTTDSTSSELMPRWSPDNDELLFLAHDNAYVSPSIGGTPRLVARGTEGDGMVRSASWSPDGDSIVLVRNDSLTVRPLRGAGSRFLGQFPQLHSCVWSPNRKWIACMHGNWIAMTPGPLFGNNAPNGIVLYPGAGGNPIELAGADYAHESPAWSADGAFLWISSDRDGTPGEVYAVRIGKDGHAVEFSRVGLRAESIDLSRYRIAYSVPVQKANVWAVPVPGDTVTSMETARQITSGNQVVEVLNGSPDGKWLVYDSNVQGNANIYRIPVAGGGSEQLTDDPRPEYAGALSPDGTELVWQRWVNGERHLFVKKLDNDAAQEIIPARGDQGVPHWSPDGRSIAAWSHNNERGAVFVVRRDVLGKWPTAWRYDGGQLPVWSPDGRSIAFIQYDGTILTIPSDSGAVISVFHPRRGAGDPIPSCLVWSLDPETLWFLANDPAGRGGIWSVPARGGTPRLRVRLDDSLGRSHGPGFATDGSRFFFTLDERITNVRWAELVRR